MTCLNLIPSIKKILFLRNNKRFETGTLDLVLPVTSNGHVGGKDGVPTIENPVRHAGLLSVFRTATNFHLLAYLHDGLHAPGASSTMCSLGVTICGA